MSAIAGTRSLPAGPVCALRNFRRLLQLGWPAASQMLFEVGAFSLATLFAARLSPDMLAAHQIVLNCASVTYMVPLGFSAGAAIAVGHAVGAGNRPLARRAGSMAIAIGVVFMAVAADAFLVIPRTLLHIYTHDSKTVAVGVRLLVVAAAFQIFDAVQGIGTGALRGLGQNPRADADQLHRLWGDRFAHRLLVVFQDPAGHLWSVERSNVGADICRGTGAVTLAEGLQSGMIPARPNEHAGVDA